MAAKISLALPDRGQQGREQGLPMGFTGTSRETKGCQLLSNIASHALPSFPPLRAVTLGHFMPHVAWQGHAVAWYCSYRRQRWEKRGKPSCFYPVQPLWSPKPEAIPKILAFAFPAPLLYGRLVPPCQQPGTTKRTRRDPLLQGLSLCTTGTQLSSVKAMVNWEQSALWLPPAASAPSAWGSHLPLCYLLTFPGATEFRHFSWVMPAGFFPLS